MTSADTALPAEARACVYTVVDHEICAIEVFARPDDAYRARLTDLAV